MTNIIFDGVDLSNIDDLTEIHDISDWSDCDIEYHSDPEYYNITNIPYSIANKTGRYNIIWTRRKEKGTIHELMEKQDQSPDFLSDRIPTLPDYVNALTVARLRNNNSFIRYLRESISTKPLLTNTKIYTDVSQSLGKSTTNVLHESSIIPALPYENETVEFLFEELDRDMEPFFQALFGKKLDDAKKNLQQLASLCNMTYIAGHNLYNVLFVQNDVLGMEGFPIDSPLLLSAHYILKSRVK